MQLSATKLQVEQNKVLENFAAKVSEKLGNFADVLLNDEGISKELQVIDEQIRDILGTIKKYPDNAGLYAAII